MARITWDKPAGQDADVVSVLGIGLRELRPEESCPAGYHDSHGALDERQGSEVCTIMERAPSAATSCITFDAQHSWLSRELPSPRVCPRRRPRPEAMRRLRLYPSSCRFRRTSRLRGCRRFRLARQTRWRLTRRRGEPFCSDGIRTIALF